MHRPIRACVASALMVLATRAEAAHLAPGRWVVTDLGTRRNVAGEVTDNDLDTQWVSADGRRLPPHKGGPGTFCLTSPGAIEFVAEKMLAWIGDNPACVARFNLLPMDDTTYCQCERCVGMYRPFERPAMPYVPISPYSVSDAYYFFVAEVAARVAVKAPHARVGALAYADVHAPPRSRSHDLLWLRWIPRHGFAVARNPG